MKLIGNYSDDVRDLIQGDSTYNIPVDIKTDEVEEMPQIENDQSKLDSLLNDLSNAEEEACESCSI